jgi:hypothetical protein
MLSAYRSTAPDVLEAWREWQRRAVKFHDECWNLARLLGPDRSPVGSHSWGDRRLDGVSHDPNAPVPVGWRLVTKRGEPYVVPLKNRKSGAALAAAIEAVRLPVLKLPGMPERIWEGNAISYPSGGLFADAMFIAWDVEPERVEDGKSRFGEERFDAERWSRIKLSEFFAAQEAHEAGERKEATR